MDSRLFKLGIAFVAGTLATRASADLSGGYIYQAPTEIDYLTITQTDHKLTGYIQSVEKNASLDGGFRVAKLTIRGDISGSSFTVYIQDREHVFGGGPGDCSGKATSSGLKLLVPKENGQTSSLTFVRSTPEHWNSVVASFEKACGVDALRQSWRVAIQTHFANLKQLAERGEKDQRALADLKARQESKLSELQQKLSATEERKRQAEKVRDYLQSEADKMAEVAKDARDACGENGKSRRGYIGLTAIGLNDVQRRANPNGGVLVESVKADGPASSAGIKAKDVIVRIGSSNVANQVDFFYALLKNSPGSSVELELSRTGQTMTVSLTLANPPEASSFDKNSLANDMLFASNDANFRVQDAKFNIQSVDFDIQSVSSSIEQVNREIAETKKKQDENERLRQAIQAEGKVLQPNEAVVKKLWNGSLWTATATTETDILSWPMTGSASVYHLKSKQSLSVLPMGSDWCMVLLQNKTLGWVSRRALAIKGG